MAKAKRSREASLDLTADTQKRSKAGDLDQTTSIKVASLNILARLPSEVVERILEHACFSPPLPRPNASASSQAPTRRKPFIPQMAYDGKTAISLLTASRSLYAVVVGILYAEVCLTRPSALSLFHQALKSNPDLRRRVRRINVGPQDELPDEWWPIAGEEEHARSRCIAFGLSEQQKDGLPLRLPRARRWVTEEGTPSFVQQHLVRIFGSDQDDVLQRAARMRGESKPAEMQTWLCSVFELQAKLDLYALEMRKVVDEGLHHYPDLVITSTLSTQSTSSGLYGRTRNNFFLPRPMLFQHLFRRGSLADWFDHPLLCARSGLSVCSVDTEGNLEFNYAAPTSKLVKQAVRGVAQPNATTFNGIVALILAVKELTGLADSQIRIWPEVLAEGVRIREDCLAKPDEEKEEESDEGEAGREGGQSEQEQGGSEKEEDDGLFADAVDTEDDGEDILNSLP